MLHCFNFIPANWGDFICRSCYLKWTENIWWLKAALKVYYVKLLITNSQEILFEKIILKTLYASLFINLKRKYIEAFLLIFEIFFELLNINSNKTTILCTYDKNSLLKLWVFFPRHYIDAKIKRNWCKLDKWL